MSDLIDTTEMYLRTIYELDEDGITPMRARIAEQLGHSGPTVSQTIARMERDGLVVVHEDRRLELTGPGRSIAVSVMRKHRLAERLLLDILGLALPYVHDEACRWEHVMSERVEKRIFELLESPLTSPYGNPIPGLADLGQVALGPPSPNDMALDRAILQDFSRAELSRIGEGAQVYGGFLQDAAAIQLLPGALIDFRETQGIISVATAEGELEISPDVARHLFVIKPS